MFVWLTLNDLIRISSGSSSWNLYPAMERQPLRRNEERVYYSIGPSSVDYNPSLAEHIISQVQRELDAEVFIQNRAANDTSGDRPMREIRNVASAMREAIAALKQRAGTAVSDFQSEVKNSHYNLDKVDSVTSELKEANKEVEAMLGTEGSNFPPTSSDTGMPVDENGVWANPEHKK